MGVTGRALEGPRFKSNTFLAPALMAPPQRSPPDGPILEQSLPCCQRPGHIALLLFFFDGVYRYVKLSHLFMSSCGYFLSPLSLIGMQVSTRAGTMNQ